jgi:hypothetical protein
LIAWDDYQDDRLFVVSQADVSTYARLVELLNRGPGGWPPKLEWKFRDDKDKEEADSLVDSSRKSLYSSELLVLGTHINEGSIKLIEINCQIENEVNKALKLNAPDNLSNWFPRLSINSYFFKARKGIRHFLDYIRFSFLK